MAEVTGITRMTSITRMTWMTMMTGITRMAVGQLKWLGCLG